MKIKYTGKKAKMTVTLPPGCGKSAQRGAVDFYPGKVVEMTEEDGKKLLELNAHNPKKPYIEVKETKEEEVKAEPVETKVEDKPKRGRPWHKE